MTKKTIAAVIKQYVDTVKKNGIPVQDVYLFGSTAKGNTHKGSDIDICIVSPSFGKNRFDERLKLMNLRDGISDLIEPHPYSPADFNNPYDPLSAEIVKTGIHIK